MNRRIRMAVRVEKSNLAVTQSGGSPAILRFSDTFQRSRFSDHRSDPGSAITSDNTNVQRSLSFVLGSDPCGLDRSWTGSLAWRLRRRAGSRVLEKGFFRRTPTRSPTDRRP